MTRNLKALGLALLATFAFSAVAASEASAEQKIFDSVVNPIAILKGTSENNQVFTRGIIPFTCAHLALEGTVEGTSADTVELSANYTTPSCTGPLSSVVHIDFTSGQCGYHFTGTTSKTAVAKLVCKNGGGAVTLTATNPDGSSLCSIVVPPQTFGGHVAFTNIEENGKSAVTAESTITGIKSTRTGNAACGPVNNETGTYTGSATITAYEPIHVAGEQVNAEVT